MLNWQASQYEKQNTLDFSEVRKAVVADEEDSAEMLGSKQMRPAVATNDMRASNCKKCNFITNLESHPQVIDMKLASSIKVVMCSRCSGKYHD